MARGTDRTRFNKGKSGRERDEDDYNDEEDAYIHDYDGNGQDSPLEVIKCSD